jgi:hypothetical protein
MTKTIKILVVIFFQISISKIEVSGQIINADSSKLVTDSFEVFPFDVKILSKDLSIYGNGVGKAFLRLYINKQGEVFNFDVIKFKYIRGNKKYSFTFSDNNKSLKKKYPKIINSNLFRFQEYIKKNIVIKKVSENNIRNENIYIIPVNLE